MYVSDYGSCARHPIPSFLSFTEPHHCPAPGYTECAGMGWVSWACSPNCRTQMPIHSRMSCSSGPELAHGSWHPCGTLPWLRSGPWRVYLSAKKKEIFGSAVRRWAGQYICRSHLSKQAYPGFRVSCLQFTGEYVELAPPTDRSSKHRCSFLTQQGLRVKLVQLSSF